MNLTNFNEFLNSLESAETLPTNHTNAGHITIEQTPRNQLRRQGMDALIADLKASLPSFDVVETANGIVIAAENAATGYTIS